METSPSSSSSSSRRHDRKKFFVEVISPAIRRQSCPICLGSLHNHRKTAVIINCLHAYCLECIRKWSNLKRRCPLCNGPFHSWFCRFSFSSRQFLTEKLPPLKVTTKETESHSRREIRRESVRVIREETSSALPWQRSFGPPGSSANVVAERKLQWRASVYNRGIQAVPLPSGNFAKLDMTSDRMRERMRERIEPWIRRELQAILDDPDPTVIVYVASSRYISCLAPVRRNVHSSQLGVEDNFLAPLLRFLGGRTKMFWHELRCFAESSLSIEAYDEVVRYERSHQVSRA